MPKLVFLGVGQVALQVARLANQYDLFGTTRDADKFSLLQAKNITPVWLKPTLLQSDLSELEAFFSKADVLVSFPPDEKTDLILANCCTKANTIIYISSTAVYGAYEGIVDESTKVDYQAQRSKVRLQAEEIWRSQGAVILRAPGLYGPDSGLHLRLRSGTYRLPPYNTNYISRIHLKDFARIILAAFAKPLPKRSLYLIGDQLPATQIEVIQWLCQRMNLSIPPLAEPDAVPTTLTANRRVNAKKILCELNLELEFPTFREGYEQCLTGLNI